jgi:hypothetical protein
MQTSQLEAKPTLALLVSQAHGAQGRKALWSGLTKRVLFW